MPNPIPHYGDPGVHYDSGLFYADAAPVPQNIKPKTRMNLRLNLARQNPNCGRNRARLNGRGRHKARLGGSVDKGGGQTEGGKRHGKALGMR